MKITFQAFRWECNSQALNLDQFVSILQGWNGRQIRNRIIYVIDSGELWNGLVLTIKDLKKFTKLVNSQQEIRLDIHELEANEQVADFNFFILDKQSGYGLYQHYHNSCSLNLFNVISKQYYREIKYKMRNEEKEKLENKNITKKELATALKKFSGDFNGSIIERKGTFSEKIAKLQDAHEAEIEFDELDFTDGAFQAVSSHIKRVKHQLFFLKNTSRLDRVRGLTKIFMHQPVRKAKVVGVDENGNDIIYKMLNDFDKFATYDYEDMVPELQLNQVKVAESISNNKIVYELRSVFGKISAAFV